MKTIESPIILRQKENREKGRCNMKSRLIVILLLVIVLTFVLTGCLPGDGKRSAVKPGNFITGIWHGWMAPLSLVVGIFNDDISIYEKYNTGWWYEFGYYIAIISGFGSLALFRGKRYRNRKKND